MSFDDRFVLPEPLARLRVNGPRLLQRISDLGEIGPIRGVNGEPGSARLALTDEDRAGRDLVTAWMGDLGLTVRIDAIGNVIGVRAAADGSIANPVMTGSHIDTVRTGGLYDGNLGVLAGLEIIETLDINVDDCCHFRNSSCFFLVAKRLVKWSICVLTVRSIKLRH